MEVLFALFNYNRNKTGGVSVWAKGVQEDIKTGHQ